MIICQTSTKGDNIDESDIRLEARDHRYSCLTTKFSNFNIIVTHITKAIVSQTQFYWTKNGLEYYFSSMDWNFTRRLIGNRSWTFKYMKEWFSIQGMEGFKIYLGSFSFHDRSTCCWWLREESSAKGRIKGQETKDGKATSPSSRDTTTSNKRGRQVKVGKGCLQVIFNLGKDFVRKIL